MNNDNKTYVLFKHYYVLVQNYNIIIFFELRNMIIHLIQAV